MKNFQSGRFVQQAHYKSFQPDPIMVEDDVLVVLVLSVGKREDNAAYRAAARRGRGK